MANPINLSRGLISFWELGSIKGNVVPDRVDSNNGTATSMSESNRVVGYNYQRKALDFDGGNEFIEVSGSTNLGIVSEITFCLWVSSNTTSPGIFFIKFNTSAPAGAGDYWLDSDGGQWRANIGGGVGRITARTIHAGWTHLCVTYTTSLMTFLINGVSVGTDNSPGIMIGNSNPLYIGRYDANFFDGAMQDIMIYDRALTPLEIELLHNEQRTGRRI